MKLNTQEYTILDPRKFVLPVAPQPTLQQDTVSWLREARNIVLKMAAVMAALYLFVGAGFVASKTADAVGAIPSWFWITLAVLAGFAVLGWLAWLARKAIAALLGFIFCFIIGVVIVKIILFFLFVAL